MKRNLLLIVVMLSLLLSACGGGDSTVEVKLPSMVVQQGFGEITQEEANDLVSEENGITEAKLEEDGSLVLKMTKEGHESLVEDMDNQVKDMLEQLQEMEEFSFIEEVTYTEGYKEMTIVVNSEEYAENQEMVGMVAGIIGGGAGSYQSYALEDLGVKLIIEDESGEVLDELQYPEDFADDMAE